MKLKLKANEMERAFLGYVIPLLTTQQTTLCHYHNRTINFVFTSLRSKSLLKVEFVKIKAYMHLIRIVTRAFYVDLTTKMKKTVI